MAIEKEIIKHNYFDITNFYLVSIFKHITFHLSQSPEF